MRVVVTGGGTGGHIYPALAIVEALSRIDPGLESAFVGGTQGMEAQIVPPTGVKFVGVTTRKLKKVLSPSTARVLVSLARGYGEASRFLREFKPQAVISSGGYVAAATAIAAARQRIPTIVLAPDAVPGRTNLLVSRWASKICIMFDEVRSVFPADKVVLTGLPIRAGIVSSKTVAEARSAFGLAPDWFTLLATGGSQGAQKLNELVRGAASILPLDVQILHQVGSRDENVGRLTREGYVSTPFLDADKMPLAYRAADVTVCRCGVGSLAEAAANGLPMLMVPLPTAYADHQTHNARAVVAGKGGVLLPQSDLTPEILAAQIEKLHNDVEARAEMSRASKALGRPDAADRVARIALELAL